MLKSVAGDLACRSDVLRQFQTSKTLQNRQVCLALPCLALPCPALPRMGGGRGYMDLKILPPPVV